MTRLLLSFLLLLCTLGAQAQTTVYYRNCDTGSQVGVCVNGTDGANPGTSPSSPRQALPSGSTINALAAGSNIRLCNGSAWINGNYPGWFIENTNATETSRITIEGYDCGDGATAAPLISASSGTATGMVFGGFCMSGCPSPDQGGYVLRNFRFTKGGALATGSTGISFYGSTRYTLLEGMEIDNWANGIEVSTSQNIRDLTIRTSNLHDNAQNCIIGAGSNFLIELNTFTRCNSLDNGAGSFLLEHAMYIGGTQPQSNITVRRNILVDNSVDPNDSVCKSGNLTLRGNVTGALIEENDIRVPSGDTNCYGISVIDGYAGDECVTDLVIRRNIITNVGSNGIACLLCPGVDIDSNRLIRTTSTGGYTGISIGNPGSEAAACPAGTATVRNNSGYTASGSGGTFLLFAAGSGHSAYNNLCHITAGASSTNCWSTSGATFSLFDYNWTYELGSGQYSATYATRAAACSGASFDCNGGNTDPLLASTPSPSNRVIELSSSSPLRGVGRATGKPIRDALKCLRNTTPDIGAQEYGASTCPDTGTPQFVR